MNGRGSTSEPLHVWGQVHNLVSLEVHLCPPSWLELTKASSAKSTKWAERETCLLLRLLPVGEMQAAPRKVFKNNCEKNHKITEKASVFYFLRHEVESNEGISEKTRGGVEGLHGRRRSGHPAEEDSCLSRG